MVNAPQYVDVAERSLAAGGYATARYDLAGWQSAVGYRADFRVRWMATKLHLFVCVSSAPVATAEALIAFTHASLEYAKQAKGQARGFQSGVAVISVLAADHVDPSGEAYARKQLVRDFAAFAWPVAVDVSTGQRFSHDGRPALGAIYNGWMRKQVAVAAPPVA